MLPLQLHPSYNSRHCNIPVCTCCLSSGIACEMAKDHGFLHLQQRIDSWPSRLLLSAPKGYRTVTGLACCWLIEETELFSFRSSSSVWPLRCDKQYSPLCFSVHQSSVSPAARVADWPKFSQYKRMTGKPTDDICKRKCRNAHVNQTQNSVVLRTFGQQYE